MADVDQGRRYDPRRHRALDHSPSGESSASSSQSPRRISTIPMDKFFVNIRDLRQHLGRLDPHRLRRSLTQNAIPSGMPKVSVLSSSRFGGGFTYGSGDHHLRRITMETDHLRTAWDRDIPVLQGGMAQHRHRPVLRAAVSNAGGFGHHRRRRRTIAETVASKIRDCKTR
ncbi:MAG: hypothetical protein MZU97_05135 [Bacillus subtilis]|nr:hypothetical protein [Bacillus subtilis]